MRPAIVAALAAMLGSARAGICEIIAPDLPSFCSCTDSSAVGATAECDVNFLHVDTIGLKAVFAPCAMPAHISLEVTEADIGERWPAGAAAVALRGAELSQLS